jgi:hypothetical protein
MLLQIHNGVLGACREVPKGYVQMEETDWYRLYLSPVVDKIPATKTYLPFPGLLWGTPVVDVLGATTEESAKALIDEKAGPQNRRWAVWKTPHHTHQPPGRTRKGDPPTRKRVRKTANTGESSCSESEPESDSTVKNGCESESEGADRACPEDDMDVSESDVCETDEDDVSDNAFDSDDNEEPFEEDPPEPALHLDVEDADDSDDD